MQDNRHIIGRPESGTHSAVKNSTRVLAKNQSHSAAQERPYKPKRRLIDFDVSDKSIEEDELSRLLIDKLSICNIQSRGGQSGIFGAGASPETFSGGGQLKKSPCIIVCLQDQKRASPGRG